MTEVVNVRCPKYAGKTMVLSQQQRNLNLGLCVEVQFLSDYFLLFVDKKGCQNSIEILYTDMYWRNINLPEG